ncbi:unnamed protein product [Adineta steineri]|uniref:t-SNARE coiled-coil homology domain-containing protein n=1 Tax=Adineta steineri TaxID=433720 RepID=A0A815A797_9BILA|nr:unnamed protein product [Adineta steineri]CAF3592063.1 unnamed protein product [Adineta steineri]
MNHLASASDFQRLNNAVLSNLNKITNNTNDLDVLVQKLGTQEDSEPLRDRYLRLQNDTKTLIQSTNHTLEEIRKIPIKTEADERQKQSLIQNLTKTYTAKITHFQDIQRVGARKEKESLERARSVSYRRQSVNNGSGFDNHAYTDNQYQEQVVIPMEQDVDMQALRERGDQLQQLERNIVEVNELFKDVHNLVHEQGEIIDNIENNIVAADNHVVTATGQLKQAVTYQSAARRKKIILILIAIIILVIIGLVLGLYFGLKK